jgi:hypothetical protein
MPRRIRKPRTLAHRSPRESPVRGGMSIAQGHPVPSSGRSDMSIALRHRGSQAPVGACFLTLAGGRTMPLPMNHGVIGSVSPCFPTGSLAQVTSPQVCSVLLTELEDNVSRLHFYRHVAPDGAIPSAQAWEMLGLGPQIPCSLQSAPLFFPHVKRLGRPPILQNGDNSSATNSSDWVRN